MRKLIALMPLLLAACSPTSRQVAARAVPTQHFPVTWDGAAPTVEQPASDAVPSSEAPPAPNPVVASALQLPAGVTSVAVLPLQGKGGASPQVVEVLDDIVISALQAGLGNGVRVIGKSDIDAMLGFEKSKDVAGCNDVSCAVDIAGALGVDSVLFATVGTLGSKYLLTLVWISQRETRVIGRISEDLGGEIETFHQGVQRGVQALLAVSAGAP